MTDITAAAATAGDTPTVVPVTTWETNKEGDHILVVAEPVKGRPVRRLDDGTALVGHVSIGSDGRFVVHHATDGPLGKHDTDPAARRALESHTLGDRAAFTDALACTPYKPWAEEHFDLTGYRPVPADQLRTDWSFHTACPGAAGQPRVLNWGTHDLAVPATAAAVADVLAADARYAYDCTGELTITVWAHRGDDTRSPSRGQTVFPAGAVAYLYGAGVQARVPDRAAAATNPVGRVTIEQREQWAALILDDSKELPARDPETNPWMRRLTFNGGPWDGFTRYVALGAVDEKPRAAFHGAPVTDSVMFVPDSDDDPRARYRPSGTGHRITMTWHPSHDDPMDDPMELVLHRAAEDAVDAAAFRRIVDWANDVADQVNNDGVPYHNTIEHGVSDAAPSLVAAALHKLTAVLPDITDAQVDFLNDAATLLAPSVVDILTGQHTDDEEAGE